MPLPDATPDEVGLTASPIVEAIARLRECQEPSDGSRPTYAGAVALMGHHGRIVARHVGGHALRYASATTELPHERWVPMREDTIFDLASISKVFTSIAVVQLVEEGLVDLDDAVAEHLPAFAAAGKGSVTVRQLLAHTSGLPAWLPLWSRHADPASRIAAVMQQPANHPPGTMYLYSDLNMITLGVLVEQVRSRPLDVAVREQITEPLGMADTGYHPTDRDRTAATEHQSSPRRGMVRGEVHDENAWSLGGVAGHAGVFSTADDLAVLAQALLDGGRRGCRRILSRESVARLVTNVNEDFPGHAHGLGFELDQPWYMDELSSPRTAGHTGFTGTSLVIDVASHSFAVLLTNRVHPSRSVGSGDMVDTVGAEGSANMVGSVGSVGSTRSINAARCAWARGLARALPR